VVLCLHITYMLSRCLGNFTIPFSFKVMDLNIILMELEKLDYGYLGCDILLYCGEVLFS